MLTLPRRTAPKTVAVRVPGRELFRREIAQARRLGFTVQLAVNEDTRVAAVRLVPETPRACSACFAATGEGGQVIEAKQPFQAPDERLDAVREAMRAVLELAGSVA